MDDWVSCVRQQQWKWAAQLMQHSEERWTSRILFWTPTEGYRSVGHPRSRWIDPIDQFARSLVDVADDSEAWWYVLADEAEALKVLPQYVAHCQST